MFSALDLAISGIANFKLKKKRQLESEMQPIPQSIIQKSTVRESSSERKNSISKGKRASSMQNVSRNENDNRSSYISSRHSKKVEQPRSDDDADIGRESRRSNRSFKDKKRYSIHHAVEDAADVRASQRSAKQMRKYKSVEVIRSSSEDISDEGRGSTNPSLGSLQQIETEKKVKQKQLYLELKRKQERSMRKQPQAQPVHVAQTQHNTDQPFQNYNSSHDLDQPDMAMLQAPVLPPKPKKYKTNAAQDSDSTASQRVGHTTQSLRSEHTRVKHHAHNSNAHTSIPRHKLEKHNELLKDYFEKAPVDKHIRTGVSDDELERAVDAPPVEEATGGYDHSTQASTRSHDRRRTKDRRRSGTNRSHR